RFSRDWSSDVCSSDLVPATEKAQKLEEKPAVEGEEGIIKTQYQKLSGATFTGQKIDLSQFEKPKKKKEEKKGAASDAKGAKPNDATNKNKRKRIVKTGNATTGDNKGGGTGANNQNKTGGNANRGANANTGFNKGRNQKGRPAPAVKVEPTEEEVKNQIKETLERLQGKQNKSKSAKYRKDKRELHRKKEEEARADDEHKILKVKIGRATCRQ